LTNYTRGYHPTAFKQENLLIHIANGLLLFWLTLLLAGIQNSARTFNLSNIVFAAFVALLWLLHPLHVSTVLYSVQRLVLLSAFFSLLAGILYLKGRSILQIRPIIGASQIAAALLICMPLGALSKENAVLVIPALAIAELCFFKRPIAPATRRLHAILVLAFIVLPLLVGAALFFERTFAGISSGFPGQEFTLTERALTQPNVVWKYLSLLAFPIPSNMGLFYDWFPIQQSIDFLTAAKLSLLAGSIVAAFLLRKKAPLSCFGVFWFFIWHLMESTVLPLELAFEHRNYLASLGFLLVLADAGRRLLAASNIKWALPLCALMLLTILGANTYSRATTWSHIYRIAAAEYERAPLSPRSLELMLLVSLDLNNKAQAREFATKLATVANNQTWPLMYWILLNCSTRPEVEEQLKKIRGALQENVLKPGDITLLRRLSRRVASGDCSALSPDELVDISVRMAESDRVYSKTARIAAQNIAADLLSQMGRFQEAAKTLRASVELSFEIAPAWTLATLHQIEQVADRLDSESASRDFVTSILSEHRDRLEHEGFGLLRSARGTH
jgi:hypothetical protein